jgi:kinesin family protein 11
MDSKVASDGAITSEQERSKETLTAPPTQVIVRVRPFLSHELQQQDLMSIDGSNISVIVQKQQKSFEFDGVVQDATQEEFFNNNVKQYVDLTLMGYNATVFSYGQTGSGKTYTMDGLEYLVDSRERVAANQNVS